MILFCSAAPLISSCAGVFASRLWKATTSEGRGGGHGGGGGGGDSFKNIRSNIRLHWHVRLCLRDMSWRLHYNINTPAGCPTSPLLSCPSHIRCTCRTRRRREDNKEDASTDLVSTDAEREHKLAYIRKTTDVHFHQYIPGFSFFPSIYCSFKLLNVSMHAPEAHFFLILSVSLGHCSSSVRRSLLHAALLVRRPLLLTRR